jgi:hypothetical protein
MRRLARISRARPVAAIARTDPLSRAVGICLSVSPTREFSQATESTQK